MEEVHPLLGGAVVEGLSLYAASVDIPLSDFELCLLHQVMNNFLPRVLT